jgi:vitamin B12 transporter
MPLQQVLTYIYSMGHHFILSQRVVRLACLTLLLGYGPSSWSQIDSIIALHGIEVTAQRIDFTDIGKHSENLDTSRIAKLRSATLSSMLADQTPLYVRSYGNGTLATLGIRGGGASHTQIIWNGIPIRNPMIGLVDIALIPSLFIDHASVHYGGHGSAFGSGAVGGLIAISNETVNNKNGAEAKLSYGSWDQRSAELKLNYGFKKWRFSTRAFTRYAKNDYRYIPLKGLDPKYQEHHELKDNGLLQEIKFDFNEFNSLTGRVWYQYTDRQIPPTAVQTTSGQAQQDEDLRATLEWMHKGEHLKWQVKSAWLDESINYQDTLILLYTHNRFKTWLAEGELSFQAFKKVDIAGGLYTERVEATSDNYPEANKRYQHAVFTTARYSLEKWTWRFQMREELTDDHWSPLLLDVGTEWAGIKSITLKASVSRNYRTPTLNDLYWSPGGNPDLQPEQGWTVESGVHYKSPKNKIQWGGSLTGYARKIDDWIMWLPPVKDVRNFWSPTNLSEVNSTGLECRADGSMKAGAWNLSLQTGVDLTWSTFGTAIPDLQIEPGDQLFYVPIDNISGTIKATFQGWTMYYQHHWFGASTGINEDVQAANVGAAGLGYSWLKSKLGLDILLQVDNVWDVPYRMIERRPMPGRGFELGLKVSL